MNHGLVTRRIQPEYHAPVQHAAQLGSSKKIPGRVASQIRRGPTTVVAAGEGVQHSLVARRIQLENHAVGEVSEHQAPIVGRAIKVACPVEDQTGERRTSVGAAREGV